MDLSQLPIKKCPCVSLQELYQISRPSVCSIGSVRRRSSWTSGGTEMLMMRWGLPTRETFSHFQCMWKKVQTRLNGELLIPVLQPHTVKPSGSSRQHTTTSSYTLSGSHTRMVRDLKCTEKNPFPEIGSARYCLSLLGRNFCCPRLLLGCPRWHLFYLLHSNSVITSFC